MMNITASCMNFNILLKLIKDDPIQHRLYLKPYKSFIDDVDDDQKSTVIKVIL